MKKRLFSVIAAIVLAAVSILSAFSAFADDVSWSYDTNNNTLYIFGSGKMDDYSSQYTTPWVNYINSIVNVEIDEGVTSVGAFAFSGAKKLENVSLPSTLTAINENAFSSCSALSKLYIPSAVTSIRDESFAYDGTAAKENFALNADSGSYALYYAVKNKIPFECNNIVCDQYNVNIAVKGMRAYYKYSPLCDGTYKFYSTGAHDTVGYFYDSELKQIKYNDDASSSDTNFSITCDLKKGETYYIATNILNSSISAVYKLKLEAVSFTVSGTVRAMLNPEGAASDFLLTDACIDNVPVGEGFTVSVNGTSVTKTFTYLNQSKTITFTPDTPADVVFNVCDVNGDRYVNAKDFALMKKADSPYIALFKNFINYHY